MVCAFFGHRDTPMDVAPRLRETLLKLIVKRNIFVFYVGYHGAFDRLVIRTLSKLKATFPHITVTVVLPYLPATPLALPSGVETLFPAEAATAPPSVCHRPRKSVVDRSLRPVCHVYHPSARRSGNLCAPCRTKRQGDDCIGGTE